MKKLLTNQETCDIIDTERGENKSPEKERKRKNEQNIESIQKHKNP